MTKSTIVLFSIVTAIISTITSFGQAKREKEIAAEGELLYKSEMVSWYGTDVFMEKFPDKKTNLGGYISYDNGNTVTCIFFSKSSQPKILATISFDSTYNVKTAIINGEERELTTQETDLYAIRKITLAEIQSDTLFKRFKNTSLNLIPVSDDLGKRVYVITGPQKNGVVIFGNDYLLSFKSDNQLKDKIKLHKSLIPIDYGTKDGNIILSSVHTHLPEYSDLITATDICSLRLYEKFAKWEQHYVMSRNFVSIWNCQTNKLTVLTKKAWEKINKDQMLKESLPKK